MQLALPDMVWVVHHGLVGSLIVTQLKLILEQIRPQYSLQQWERYEHIHAAEEFEIYCRICK
jgi:hypothetical protein